MEGLSQRAYFVQYWVLRDVDLKNPVRVRVRVRVRVCVSSGSVRILSLFYTLNFTAYSSKVDYTIVNAFLCIPYLSYHEPGSLVLVDYYLQ